MVKNTNKTPTNTKSSSQMVKTTTKSFTLKALMLGMMALTHQHTLADGGLFAQSPSSSAKSAVVAATKQLMADDVYMVSNQRFELTPLSDLDAPIDQGARPLIKTLANTYFYKQMSGQSDSTNPDAYRTAEDYLSWPKLPYLAFDEENQTDNGQTVSRLDGMSDAYQEMNDQIGEYNLAIRQCIADTQKMDEVLFEDYSLTTEDQAIRDGLAQLDACVQATDSLAQELLPLAQGRQTKAILRDQMCVKSYQRDLEDILSPKRQQKQLDYDLYDSTYSHYFLCQAVNEFDRQLEPATYINRQSSQAQLEIWSSLKQCQLSNQGRLQGMILAGENYATNPEKFKQSYYDYIGCANQVLENAGLETLSEPVVDAQTAADHYSHQMAQVESLTYESQPSKEDQGGNHPLQWLDAYQKMKAEEKTQSLSPMVGMFSDLLYSNQLTTEQIAARNNYQYQYLTASSVLHHSPSQYRTEMIYALDYQAPTTKLSFKLPMQFDIKQASLKLDASALLPIVATVNPKHTPLPQEIPNGLVEFYLPNEIKNALPPVVIVNAVQRAFIQSFEVIDEERFTPISIGQDAYAKRLGAASAIKLHLSTKDLGRFYGLVVKQIGHELKAYVDAHPQFYVDDGSLDQQKIKQVIDNWADVNQDYRSQDVASIFALIGAVVPVDLNSSQYYYLDKQGNLTGIQFFQTIDNGIENTRLKVLTQISLGQKAFDGHALTKSFRATFDGKAMDGNQKIQVVAQENQQLALAEQARLAYEQEDDLIITNNLPDLAEAEEQSNQTGEAVSH